MVSRCENGRAAVIGIFYAAGTWVATWAARRKCADSRPAEESSRPIRRGLKFIVQLFGSGQPVTYERLRTADVPCPRMLARNRLARGAPSSASPAMSDVVDGDGDGDSRRTLPPSPRSEPGSPIVVVQPHNDWPALLPDDEEYVERHAERYRNYIAGDPPRDQDEARARARAGRQVFTGSGAGGALSPLMMVLVHHGLRRNGIALPAGRVVLNRATTSMLYGGPVAEAAWQRVFAEARNLDSWAACRAMAVQAVATVPARRVDAILNGIRQQRDVNLERDAI